MLGLHTGVVLGVDLSGGYSSVNPVRPLIGSLRFATGNDAPVGFNVDVLPGGGDRGGEVVYGAAAVSVKYWF